MLVAAEREVEVTLARWTYEHPPDRRLVHLTPFVAAHERDPDAAE